jgi:hypothetical protein
MPVFEHGPTKHEYYDDRCGATVPEGEVLITLEADTGPKPELGSRNRNPETVCECEQSLLNSVWQLPASQASCSMWVSV